MDRVCPIGEIVPDPDRLKHSVEPSRLKPVRTTMSERDHSGQCETIEWQPQNKHVLHSGGQPGQVGEERVVKQRRDGFGFVLVETIPSCMSIR